MSSVSHSTINFFTQLKEKKEKISQSFSIFLLSLRQIPIEIFPLSQKLHGAQIFMHQLLSSQHKLFSSLLSSRQEFRSRLQIEFSHEIVCVSNFSLSHFAHQRVLLSVVITIARFLDVCFITSGQHFTADDV